MLDDAQDYAELRERMVRSQLEDRGLRSAAVLAAMREVPRERFVDADMAEFAYEDSPLPIDRGQTISQPFIVAAMIEAAEVGPADRVLEVGAGSGYATAVLSRVAAQVCAIERHEPLARRARERLDALRYTNVDIVVGDGSRGWAEPLKHRFDAILVSAAGPEVPMSLKAQLAPGGRLVMPVGEREQQQLIKVTRRGENDFEQQRIGAVSFVPLVGEQGWREDRTDTARLMAAAAIPLPAPEDAGFGRLFARFADRRIVMLGECSHGTSEFYRARAAITQHLIEAHGFDLVAVEADWPDAAAIDRHVRLRPAPAPATRPFQRFPSWMWRNAEFARFVGWLRRHNAAIAEPARRAAFCGLDIYNMHGSIAEVLAYLDRVDPAAAAIARERYGCLTPWQKDPATYGRAARHGGFQRCEDAVVAQCRELLGRKLGDALGDGDDFIDAAQNARLVAAAERYYRTMYQGGASSWNLRDSHMADTLARLLEHRGPQSRAVVWAHNSHIGDARHTEMGTTRDEHNIGQLIRQRFGAEQVALIGFGTHNGTVAAASDWDAGMEVMRVRPSRSDSYERICHDSGLARFLLDFSDSPAALRQRLLEPRLQRFIGVIYRPDTERWSHYSESVLPLQYDGFVWFDQTQAVTPLGGATEAAPAGSADDLYPFGL